MTGLVRAVVQSAVATGLAWGPVQAFIAWVGWDITSDNVEAALIPVVMGVFYALFDWLQRNPRVQRSAVLRLLVGSAMGGGKSPSYEP